MGAVPDFTGYATRNGLKCADGRIIMAGAFKGNDGQRVPLVWQHGHDSPENVLGHAILQNVADGVRASAFFNSTSKAQVAKQLVSHGDITQLSIYANQLVQKGPNVHHGNIREVSLVLSGANPGATIDPVSIRHGDDLLQLDDEAIITTGEDFVLSHAITDPEVMKPSTKMPAAGKPTPENPDPDGDKDNDLFDPADGGLDMNTATVADVLNTLTDEQKQVVYALLGAAVDNTQHSGVDGSDNTDGGIDMTGLAHAAGGDVTVAQMLESFTEDQQRTVYALIGAAVEHAQHSGIITGDNNEGDPVARNVFDQSGQGGKTAPSTAEPYVLSHEDVKGLMAAGMKCGSLKFACENFALEHGIESVDVMFPEVKLLQNEPDFQSRRMEWVNGVLTGTRKSPFSRVKTILADITQAEARAKGYVKGNMKDEEFFGVVRRTTTPTTVYKKQKLDRDDILDITDFDVIAWMKGEMRLMLDEEVARAILIGDGRDLSSQDKIKDPVGASDGAGIRSILNDHEIYVTTLNVNIDDANSTADEIVDAVVAGMRFYRGTGMPTFYTTLPVLSKLLLAKDTLGRRLYPTQEELASALLVKNIVTVEPMEEISDVLSIIVNLADYNIGADNGGDVALFDFFDIDFNQQKYLIETRLSGALVKYKSALVVKKVAAADVRVDPVVAPTSDGVTVSGLNQANVTYAATDKNGSAVTISSGALTLTAVNSPVTVQATPASGYYFASNAEDSWVFTYQP